MEVEVKWVEDQRREELELNALGDNYAFLSVKCFTEWIDEALRFHEELYQEIYKEFASPCAGIVYASLMETSNDPYCEDFYFFKDVDEDAVLDCANRFIKIKKIKRKDIQKRENFERKVENMFRCLDCPVENQWKKDCPLEVASQCKFVKSYRDERGWKYQVLPGLGDHNFKVRYQRPEKSGTIGWKGARNFKWYSEFDKAQEELNKMAEKKRWRVWEAVE